MPYYLAVGLIVRELILSNTSYPDSPGSNMKAEHILSGTCLGSHGHNRERALAREPGDLSTKYSSATN